MHLLLPIILFLITACDVKPVGRKLPWDIDEPQAPKLAFTQLSTHDDSVSGDMSTRGDFLTLRPIPGEDKSLVIFEKGYFGGANGIVFNNLDFTSFGTFAYMDFNFMVTLSPTDGFGVLDIQNNTSKTFTIAGYTFNNTNVTSVLSVTKLGVNYAILVRMSDGTYDIAVENTGTIQDISSIDNRIIGGLDRLLWAEALEIKQADSLLFTSTVMLGSTLGPLHGDSSAFSVYFDPAAGTDATKFNVTIDGMGIVTPTSSGGVVTTTGVTKFGKNLWKYVDGDGDNVVVSTGGIISKNSETLLSSSVVYEDSSIIVHKVTASLGGINRTKIIKVTKSDGSGVVADLSDLDPYAVSYVYANSADYILNIDQSEKVEIYKLAPDYLTKTKIHDETITGIKALHKDSFGVKSNFVVSKNDGKVLNFKIAANDEISKLEGTYMLIPAVIRAVKLGNLHLALIHTDGGGNSRVWVVEPN